MEAIEIRGLINNEGRLIVTDSLPVRNKNVRVMLLIEEDEIGRDEWLHASAERLNQAYGEDEPEYSLDMIKEPNPQYRKNEKG